MLNQGIVMKLFALHNWSVFMQYYCRIGALCQVAGGAGLFHERGQARSQG